MKTPFLVIRFVLFALIGYLNVLSIALAAWNVGAARAARVDGACVTLYAITFA